MTDETTAQQGGAAAAASNEPAQQQAAKPAPKSDAEAAQQEAAEAVQEPSDAEKAAKVEADKQADEKKRNRTKAYIDRINGENADMRRRLAEIEARQQPQQLASQPSQHRQEGPPTLEEHNFDFAAWTEANNAYNRRQWVKEQNQQAADREKQESQARYYERAAAFADEHPDFEDAVGSIDPNFLTPDLQAAVMGHEKGPEIAYFLANNEDALWNIASVRADLLPAAIVRLASRLGEAQPAARQPQAIAPAPQQQSALQPKPISQAPAPVPTVSGRSPTETPPEKMTDDEWYRRDVERRRKR